tara:strand:+ start:1314 stop:1757 length:444 start_codon:yes stop_codon:yes gene_type:complete
VELALWFHDAVYKPFSGSNEKDSSDWAFSFLTECGAAQDAIERVYQLIMVTAHNAPIKSADEAALVDIDLAVLGCDPAHYALFEQAVRREYRLVPWFLYRKKRAEILTGFLQRPRIYTSGIFADSVERQARDNLAQALLNLTGKRSG